jgi:hypothetical protein
MPAESHSLSNQRQLTVVLRLVTDPDGRLLHGELTDVRDGSRIRFRGWHGLTHTLRAWLTTHADKPSAG